MPIFKTNLDIFKTFGEELYNPNHFDNPNLQLPPNPAWDHNREPQMEDIDIWEVILESGGGLGLYAAWCPYAKFYMLRRDIDVETYFGDIGEQMLEKRLKELNISYPKA
jgi:hypothetical protein